MKSSLDNRKYGCGIFIDFQKVFDTLNHSILLLKLEHYGIRGNALDWFKSYLAERKQYVPVNRFTIAMSVLPVGLRRDLSLVLSFFLICINDLRLSSSKLAFYLFAGDTDIY